MATRESSPRKSSKLSRRPGLGATRAPGKAGKTVLYLYGITPNSKAFSTHKLALPGVSGANPVIALPCGELLAWASRVSRAEFADSLAANMQNLEWLANASVRHQAVLDQLGKRGAVLPARFGLVFSTEQALARDVASRRGQLMQQFRKVAEADEWGIKVFRVRPQLAILSDANSGADYMRRKAEVMRSQGRDKPGEVSVEIRNLASALKELVRDVAPGGSVSSAQPGLEWQISVLLPRNRRARFDQIIRRSAKEWEGVRRIEVTGPWPPYSFVKGSA